MPLKLEHLRVAEAVFDVSDDADDSSIVDLGEAILVGLRMPNGWEAVNVNLKVGWARGDLGLLYNSDGSLYTVTVGTLAAARQIALAALDTAAFRFVQLHSTAPLAGDQVVKLLYRAL